MLRCTCWQWKSKGSAYIIWYAFEPKFGAILTKSYGPKYAKIWAFWQKRVFKNHFWQHFDAILEDVSAAVTIVAFKTINFQTTVFLCFKNYGSPTRILKPTKLKFASNMADPKAHSVALKGQKFVPKGIYDFSFILHNTWLFVIL